MLYLIIVIVIVLIIAGMSHIMSNTGIPSNKEMDLVDLRIQKYKHQIEELLKEKTHEKKNTENPDNSMEAELTAMVQATFNNEQIELPIEELPLTAIDK